MIRSSDLESAPLSLVSSLSQFTRTTLHRRFKFLAIVAATLCLIVLGAYKTAMNNRELLYRWNNWQGEIPLGERLDIPEWVQALAPENPTEDDLPPGSTILPDVEVHNLPPPVYHPFPRHLLSELYPHPAQIRPQPPPMQIELDENAWVNTWTSPDWFAKAATHNERERDIPRIQYPFENEKEDSAQKLIREGRKEAVKRGFTYAWQKYKQYAWGE